MLLSPAQAITAHSLAVLPGFVADQIRRIAHTHQKRTWEYHQERISVQAFSPWLYLDELFWLWLRGSQWWLDYGGTGQALVEASQQGRAADTTDAWLLADLYGQVEGEVSRLRLWPWLGEEATVPPPAGLLPRMDQQSGVDRPMHTGKLTVWRIFFHHDEGGQPAVLPDHAPQTDPALRAMVLQ